MDSQNNKVPLLCIAPVLCEPWIAAFRNIGISQLFNCHQVITRYRLFDHLSSHPIHVEESA